MMGFKKTFVLFSITLGFCLVEGRSKISENFPKASEHDSVEESREISAVAKEESEEIQEQVGRYLVAQVGTMLCYRKWEETPKADFHLCNVCFNNTLKSTMELPTTDHNTEVEGCFSKYLTGTDFNTCLPMIRNASLPNKKYDIVATEPEFYFSYRNFVRCAHGVVLRQETMKCVMPNEEIRGMDEFLDKFTCVANNMVAESRRFSEANLRELLNSVPQSNQTASALSSHNH